MPFTERSVVILGKVGSGKRTLGNHIAGKNVFGRELDGLGTRNVDVHYGKCMRENTNYRILTVDTESSHTGYNDPIEHIKKKLEMINLVIFVIPHGRYTSESHNSLQHAVESLNQDPNLSSALVITHCDSIEASQREKIIAEFRGNSRSSQVVAFMTKGAYAVGFPDLSALPDNLKPILQQQIAADKEKIRKLVQSCDSPIKVEDIPRQAISTSAGSSVALIPKEQYQSYWERLRFRHCTIL